MHAMGYRDLQCYDEEKAITSMSHQSSCPHTMYCRTAGWPGKDRQGALGKHLLTEIHDGSIFRDELQVLHVALLSWTAGQPANEHKRPAASQDQA